MLVGHVTKDGSIAGPRALEHLVDVVLHFEGDRHAQLRMVRALKNRFGPTDEVGCFDLGERGLIGLADPSGLFLSQRGPPVPGTCVTVTLEGRRPLIAEVQALVAPSPAELPRRVTSGLDSDPGGDGAGRATAPGRRQARQQDVYAATVGGVRLTEPSVDLAVALAFASGADDLSVPGRSSRSVRWAWPARCARSTAWPAGWPKRSGWASGSPWCRREAGVLARAVGGARTARGRRRGRTGSTEVAR